MRRNQRYRPSAQRVAPATTALQLRGKLGKLRERGRSGAADRDATDATATTRLLEALTRLASTERRPRFRRRHVQVVLRSSAACKAVAKDDERWATARVAWATKGAGGVRISL